jgi:glycosyltransferase 2 family protein
VTNKLTSSTPPKQIAQNRQSIIRLVVAFATILISLAIMVLLVYRERELLFTFEWQFRGVPALLSFTIFSGALFLAAWIWAGIMGSVGTDISLARHFTNYCLANVAKRIPGTIWYIAGRAHLYKQEGVSIRYSSLASGVEIVLAVISGILVTLLLAAPILARYGINMLWLVMLLLAGLLALHPRFLKWIFRRTGSEVDHFSYTKLMLWVASYAIVWVLGGIVLFSVGNVVATIQLADLGYVISSWVLVGVISSTLLFSPSNLGVTEVGLSLLLSTIVPAPVAVVISILMRVLLIFYEIIWALICILLKIGKKPAQ